MKSRLYLETTIPSYLTARPSRDLIVAAHQQITREWWDNRLASFEIYISQFVLEEAGKGDPEAALLRLRILDSIPLLEITEDVVFLSSELVRTGTIPKKAMWDAFHIATSAVHAIEYLMTWNCTHIANATILRKIQKVCEQCGFFCPVICTPEELLEDSP